EHRIQLIEDCAQSLGATFQSRRTGSFGIGCFSFGEGKNLYTMGGGMITTFDAQLAKQLREVQGSASSPTLAVDLWKIFKTLAYRFATVPAVFTVTAFPLLYLDSLRNKTTDTDSEHTLDSMGDMEKGCNQLSRVQAALGIAQLKNLSKRNQRRRDNGLWLSEALAGIEGLVLPPNLPDRIHLYMHYALKLLPSPISFLPLRRRGKSANNSSDGPARRIDGGDEGVLEDRERIVRMLIRKGIDAQRDYCSFCPNLPDFKTAPGTAGTGSVNLSCNVPGTVATARSLEGRVIYLPTQPDLGKDDMIRIARALKDVLKK
ncbi:MAG: DegT/DnrJ/EryC1/StrS family aminotransferase, partial [Candidatus Omnitrophica bacterium]|nr:DegT/DnrJ/EryC1/StrS family aminotransferase [Candidatus Omnitrophota bacterium]